MAPSHASRPPNPNFALARSRFDSIYMALSKPPSAPPAFKHRGPIPATPRSGRPFTAQSALAQETSAGETPHASAVGAGLPRRTVAITGHRGCRARSNGACANLGPLRR